MVRTRFAFASLVVLLVLSTTACGKAAAPTQPTPPPATETPQAVLAVTVDALGSTEAVTALSEVTLDARQSAGRDLTYRLDFGDGTTATQPTAKHVYDRAGVFTVSVIVSSGSQTSTVSRQVTVASPLGAWLYRGYAGQPQRLHVRTLNITSQDGRTVRGLLSAPGQAERSVTGSLSGERSIRLATDDQAEVFEGSLPSVISNKTYALGLLARGGPADNARLTFDPLSGPATGPGPDVSFRMRFFSFSADYALRGYSPILFDASPSRGDDLRYFIEFGDGEVATDVSAVHPIDREGEYTARFSVVDRFGRVNSEDTTFRVRSLVAKDYYVWWFTQGQQRFLNFTSQDGDRVGGEIRLFGDSCGNCERSTYTFTGTLSGQENIRLALTGTDIVLEGTLKLSYYTYEGNRLILTQTGGADNGKVFEFWFRNGY
jgi:PKD repeat protein